MADDGVEDIATLVQGFATHIKALKSPETKEATIRQNYIDKFWRYLGWDVGDQNQRGPAECEVIIEKNVETAEAGGLRSRRPDYLFRLGASPRFVVEAKKPSIDIDLDQKAIYQAKQYAWNSTIPFAILTDFEQFRLYDTTLKPIFNEPGRGLVGDRTGGGDNASVDQRRGRIASSDVRRSGHAGSPPRWRDDLPSRGRC